MTVTQYIVSSVSLLMLARINKQTEKFIYHCAVFRGNGKLSTQKKSVLYVSFHIRIPFVRLSHLALAELQHQVFSCPICRLVCDSLNACTRHMKTFHSTNHKVVVPCPFCPETLSEVRNWRRHLLKKHSEKVNLPSQESKFFLCCKILHKLNNAKTALSLSQKSMKRMLIMMALIHSATMKSTRTTLVIKHCLFSISMRMTQD
jgi:hypothetical protein